MKKNLVLLFSMIITSIGAKAQEPTVYMYPEYKKAVQKKTRTMNGAPGPNYWQNKSRYYISASISETGKITGTEKVVYFNNGPDSLEYLVVRTYPDFYKCINVKDYVIDASDCSNGMNLGQVKFGNDSSGKYQRAGTNFYLSLPGKLGPKDSITLHISWDFVLPKNTHIREGTFFSSTFFVAYWYPQVAVYDDYNGWDFFNYTGLQEFYNDFNDYDVTIEAPGSYMVWATGDWQNASQVLEEPYLSRYTSGQKSDSVIHIIDSSSRKKKPVTKKALYRFTARAVPDFTFTASDTYCWDITSVVKGKSGERTVINLLYHPDQPQFRNLAAPAKKVIGHLSEKWPGIEYPHNRLTIFGGDGGMEYAMMINQSYMYDEQAADVLAHEISHTYFPFLVASNERRYAWMDEAFAQTLPNDCELLINGKKHMPQQVNKWLVQYVNGYIGTSMESPPMELSINNKGTTYYFSAYTRPMLAFVYLRQLVGDSLYRKTVREYIERWKFKHPSPYDFFFTFNDICGRNLDWFWKPWFFDRAFPDVAIQSVKINGGKAQVVIKQMGNLPVPLQIDLLLTDGERITVSKPADCWEKTKEYKIEIAIPAGKSLNSIEINKEMVPDIDLSNNTYAIKKV